VDLPKTITEPILGKRTRAEAGIHDQAFQMHYVRDYAFTEQHGGTKGESNDYLVMDEEQQNEDELG
jgi:hypothetical protein